MLENTEDNQIVRPVLEPVCMLEQGASHRAAVSPCAPRAQVEPRQLLGDGFPPQPFSAGQGKGERRRRPLKGIFKKLVHFQEISLLFFFFSVEKLSPHELYENFCSFLLAS